MDSNFDVIRILELYLLNQIDSARMDIDLCNVVDHFSYGRLSALRDVLVKLNQLNHVYQ